MIPKRQERSTGTETTPSHSATGIVFDIKQFAVHDGPGIRTTVFFKGCPLSCTWCHNPEGQSGEPQAIEGPTGSRISGTQYTADEIADLLNDHADILRANKGGVTFSGGEPLSQPEFLSEIIDRLEGIHVLIDTSGYAPEKVFRDVVGKSDLVHFDVKIIDKNTHIKYTGVENSIVHRNLAQLSEMEIPTIVRVPLIPGVTDTGDNLAAIAEIASGVSGLLRVELLPYNRAAGGKYKACGMAFEPGFDESAQVNCDTGPFIAAGLEVVVA